MNDRDRTMFAIVLIFFVLLIGIIVTVGGALVNVTSNDPDRCPPERDGMPLVIVVVRLAGDGVIDCHYTPVDEVQP